MFTSLHHGIGTAASRSVVIERVAVFHTNTDQKLTFATVSLTHSAAGKSAKDRTRRPLTSGFLRAKLSLRMVVLCPAFWPQYSRALGWEVNTGHGAEPSRAAEAEEGEL